MALSKVSRLNRVEVVGVYRNVQVQMVNEVLEDGKVIAQSFHRKIILPGDDYSNEEKEVQAICKAVHTDEVIDAYLINRDIS